MTVGLFPCDGDSGELCPRKLLASHGWGFACVCILAITVSGGFRGATLVGGSNSCILLPTVSTGPLNNNNNNNVAVHGTIFRE